MRHVARIKESGLDCGKNSSLFGSQQTINKNTASASFDNYTYVGQVSKDKSTLSSNKSDKMDFPWENPLQSQPLTQIEKKSEVPSEAASVKVSLLD